MPTWSAILEELQEEATRTGPGAFDAVRRKYLAHLYVHTRREVILYASKFTQLDPNASPGLITITDEDLQALMEVVHGLSGPNLDLILHSPGGSSEAAEALVIYLRSKFDHIRAIVPQMAMSAATMVACAADEVVLGKHSFLGPIDPQLVLDTPLGPRMVPAEAILDQFERAKRECKEATNLGPWLPMLSQYGPDLLVQCKNATDMSRELVETWLGAYMFRNDEAGPEKALRIADWLSGHRRFKSHSRHLSRAELEQNGLRVTHLEDDQEFQDLVLSVFHATTHTFNGTAAVKIVENHRGKAFVKIVRPVAVGVRAPQGEPGALVP